MAIRKKKTAATGTYQLGLRKKKTFTKAKPKVSEDAVVEKEEVVRKVVRSSDSEVGTVVHYLAENGLCFDAKVVAVYGDAYDLELPDKRSVRAWPAALSVRKGSTWHPRGSH